MMLDPLDPDPGKIVFSDIAHGLSMKCRYSGQCNRFYSVAEHSVLAFRLARVDDDMTPELALQVLLHDAAEAYLADIAAPVKRDPAMKFFCEAEDRLLSVILTKFGLPPVLHPRVKKYDSAAFNLEWPEVFAGDYSPRSWVEFLHPCEAEREFRKAFQEARAFQRSAADIIGA